MRSAKNWILATFILTFLVIIAGGVVRTTHSGMGCPDWPRCFGKWIPPTNADQLPADFEKYLSKQDIDHSFNAFHTWIEYVNRLLGVLLGLFAIIQTALLFRNRKTEKRAFRLSLLFLGLVILTGLFGALVVKLNLAHASITVHLLFAILLTQVQLALWLQVSGKINSIVVDKKWIRLLYGFLAIVAVQSVLGTEVRIYVDDISAMLNYSDRHQWLAGLPTSFLIHRTFSWVVLLYALYIAFASRSNVEIKRKIWPLTGVILLSMITGIVLFYLDMPAIAQPTHLLLASVAITLTVSGILQMRRSEKI